MRGVFTSVPAALALILLPGAVGHFGAGAAIAAGSTLSSNANGTKGQQIAMGSPGEGDKGDGGNQGGGGDQCDSGWQWGSGGHDCTEEDCDPHEVSKDKDHDDDECGEHHHHHHHEKDKNGHEHDWWT